MEASADHIATNLKSAEATNSTPEESKESPGINNHFNPQPSKLTLEERLKLCMSVAEESFGEAGLRELLEKKEFPVCYDGFEPSSFKIDIAQILLKTICINKLVDAGCVFVIWIADWFSLMNNKLEGDLNKVKIAGKYLIEIFKGSGLKLDNVKFLWASEEINKNPNEYWIRVFDITRRNSSKRILDCVSIMGRRPDEGLAVSQVLYPCMQCADAFFLGADICQMKTDQREASILVEEYCNGVKIENKPIMLLNHVLAPFSQTDNLPIFLEDSEDDVKKKIKKAYCPPTNEGNPCLEYIKYIVLELFGEFLVERPEKYGGDKKYTSYEEVEKDYLDESLHPGDLKAALIKAIYKIIKPIRDHFMTNPEARKLFEQVEELRVNKPKKAEVGSKKKSVKKGKDSQEPV